jgi:hypothetical protein
MEKQNLIKQTLSQPASIEYVKELLESKQIPNRSKLSEKVCEHFDFVDDRGHLQKSSCVIALCELEAVGHFILPRLADGKGSKGKRHTLRRLSDPVPEPVGVPAKAGDVQGLKLVVVETDEQKRT